MAEVLTNTDQLLSTSKAQTRNHHARVRQVSFDEPSHKGFPLALGIFRRLGREGSEFVDQLWRRVSSEEGMGWAMAKKGICEERLLLIVSVTSKLAISYAELAGTSSHYGTVER